MLSDSVRGAGKFGDMGNLGKQPSADALARGLQETAQRMFAECSEADQLVRAAQAGQKMALAWLVEAFEPLVCATASRYRDVSYKDAKQEGYAALLKCVERYDANRNIPFAAYAQAHVRGDVRTAMRREWTLRDRTHRDRHDNGPRGGAAGGGAQGGHGAEDGQGKRGPRARREPGRRGRGTPAGDAFLEESMTRADLRMLLDVAGLSPRERLSVEGVMQGLSSTEIAKKYGVSSETAKTWRKRAVRKLRIVWLK